jgi:hypothetical protein
MAKARLGPDASLRSASPRRTCLSRRGTWMRPETADTAMVPPTPRNKRMRKSQNPPK